MDVTDEIYSTSDFTSRSDFRISHKTPSFFKFVTLTKQNRCTEKLRKMEISIWDASIGEASSWDDDLKFI